MKGIFRGKAQSWGLGETKDGKEQVAVTFALVVPAGAPPPEHSTVTWFGYFTEKTWARTIESLQHCGWKSDDLSDLSGLDANEVELVIDEEEYDGKTQTKVRWVNKAGGGFQLKAPLAVDRAKGFAASMKDKIRGLNASKGAPPANGSGHPPTAATAPAPAVSEKDVPF